MVLLCGGLRTDHPSVAWKKLFDLYKELYSIITNVNYNISANKYDLLGNMQPQGVIVRELCLSDLYW